MEKETAIQILKLHKEKIENDRVRLEPSVFEDQIKQEIVAALTIGINALHDEIEQNN